MKFPGKSFDRRVRAVAVAAVLIAVAFSGVVLVSQLAGAPSIRLTPQVSLCGNPVSIAIIPPGAIVKGSFFQLRTITFAPAADPSSQVTVGNLTSLGGKQTFWSPGRYVVSASYVNGGSAGIVSSTLTVLPVNFTLPALRYGSGASYAAYNASMTISDPYGLYTVPLGGASGAELSVISVYLQFSASLNTTVSNSEFQTVDGFSAARDVYAVNSTLHLTGTGYAYVLAGGVGLNLSAAVDISARSDLFNSLAGNSTVGQTDSLAGGLTLSYLGTRLNISSGNGSSLDSFAPSSPAAPVSLILQSLAPNGTFHMPKLQAQSYASVVPPRLDMNLTGSHGGYGWKAGSYVPSLGTSTLDIVFGQGANASYTITLQSNSSFPASYEIDADSAANGVYTQMHALFNSTGKAPGTSLVKADEPSWTPAGPRGNYTDWQSGPLPPINDSSLLTFPIRSAFNYALNSTSLKAYLGSNTNAFVTSATYNFSAPSWSISFASPSGEMFALNVSDIGGKMNASAYAYIGSPPGSSPYGKELLMLHSAYLIAMNSSYASYLEGQSGNLSLSSLSFTFGAAYIPQFSPLLPPPLQHAQFAITLRSSSGALLCIDAGNGQLMYFGNGLFSSLL